MRKGNVEELKVATRERIEMIVLRRDFSKQIIDKVKLKNSVISKSLFNEASIYGNEYENCEFDCFYMRNYTPHGIMQQCSLL